MEYFHSSSSKWAFGPHTVSMYVCRMVGLGLAVLTLIYIRGKLKLFLAHAEQTAKPCITTRKQIFVSRRTGGLLRSNTHDNNMCFFRNG